MVVAEPGSTRAPADARTRSLAVQAKAARRGVARPVVRRAQRKIRRHWRDRTAARRWARQVPATRGRVRPQAQHSRGKRREIDVARQSACAPLGRTTSRNCSWRASAPDRGIRSRSGGVVRRARHGQILITTRLLSDLGAGRITFAFAAQGASFACASAKAAHIPRLWGRPRGADAHRNTSARPSVEATLRASLALNTGASSPEPVSRAMSGARSQPDRERCVEAARQQQDRPRSDKPKAAVSPGASAIRELHVADACKRRHAGTFRRCRAADRDDCISRFVAERVLEQRMAAPAFLCAARPPRRHLASISSNAAAMMCRRNPPRTRAPTARRPARARPRRPRVAAWTRRNGRRMYQRRSVVGVGARRQHACRRDRSDDFNLRAVRAAERRHRSAAASAAHIDRRAAGSGTGA